MALSAARDRWPVSPSLAPAIFLDKDGTLVEDVPFNVDPARVRLAPGVAALAQLHARGYRLFVVSNQPGVALGRFMESQLHAAFYDLETRLRALGVPIEDFYYCPHAPAADATPACFCRKPNPGLLFRAAQEHDIALPQSWFIGDILDDIEAGRHAGCRTILIDNGNETEWRLSPARTPHFRARTLAEASEIILRHGGARIAV